MVVDPSISRLRSHGRAPSSVTPPRHYRSPSNFSLISETSVASAQASSSSPGIVFHPLRRLVASYGKPTTMDVNGVIAVGTEKGFTVIYSFGQEVRCVLSSLSTPVTCVSISPDSTWVGVGHATGEIYLYDLATPGKAARQVRPVTMQQVMSGRKEGHLNSKILHIGFVGARHTSIVTGDEHGRAFWWSLGRIMGVESNDVIRMLGSYQKQSSLFAMAPLPIGPHGTDQYSLSALLTPSKLVIVGLKPAKTWYRKMRDVPHLNVGATAWLSAKEEGSDPVLAYSWGRTLRFLKVIASDQTPDFVLGQQWTAPSPISAMSWYDPNVSRQQP
jgi:WD40 repeat protein